MTSMARLAEHAQQSSGTRNRVPESEKEEREEDEDEQGGLSKAEKPGAKED